MNDRRNSPQRTGGQKRPSPGGQKGQTRTGNTRSRKSAGNTRRRSRAYRRRQLQKRTLIGTIAVLVLFALIFIIRSCAGCSAKKETVSTSADASGKNSTLSSDTESITPSVTETPVVKEPVSLTVSVVGDCTLGTDENFDYDTSLNAYFESYGKEYFLSNVKDIFAEDDLTIANFEGVLTDSDEREDKQFAFKAPASFAGIVSSGNVDAVTVANNHSHDYGEQSFSDTLSALDAEGIVHFGYDETAVMEIKGIKVGLVGIYELNDHLERTEQLKTNIAAVKEAGADLIIVIFHWGNEKEEVPDDNQMTLGRLAVDEGADLVCGHHPHVLQGIETYKGKNIVYSLGNFCFGGNSYPSDMDSMIFQQTFTIDQDGVKADNVTTIIPCSISSEYDYNNYQPTPVTGEEADRIMEKIQERSSWIPTAENTNN